MKSLKLHEAIEKLLIESGQPMTTREIADELNKNKWYQKENKSPLDRYQIIGRVTKHPQLFDRDGSTVFLRQ